MNPRTHWSRLLARIALGLALVCALAALSAGPGYRLAWWSLGVGIQTIRWSAMVALGAAAAGWVAAVMARNTLPRRVLYEALLAGGVGLAVALPPIILWVRAQDLPRIHDISTDTDNPPVFVAIAGLRQNAPNSTQYSAPTAALQRSGYPDIGPVVLHFPPEQAYRLAERTARAMGWEVVATSAADLRIEATDTTLLFGFKDDVVIRISPQSGGSRVDVRSLSRVGGSDFGTNANRVRRFLAKLTSADAA